METLLFCFVALFFLMWVLVLKHETEHLKGQIRQLKERLDKQSHFLKSGVEVTDSRRLTSSEISMLDRRATQVKSSK